MTATLRSHSRARDGILFVIGATACFGALDTTGKVVTSAVPLAVAMWSRFFFQATLTGAVLLPQRGRALFATRHPWLQLLRGLLMVGSGSLAFLSLRFLPVGEFTALVMLTPLVITVVAAMSLGERVRWPQWLLLLGGFTGALVVIRPGADDFKPAMLLPLLLVAVSAAFNLLTSRLARDDDPGTMHFYSGLVSTIVASVALPFAWETPDSALLWVLLLLLGLFSTLGHYLLILGYGRASTSTLTPYLYFQIGFATLAGWLVFSHAPDRWTIIGVSLIALCGMAGVRFGPRARG